MKNKEDNIELLRWRTESYHSMHNDKGEVVEDFDDMGKLRRGFTSIDKLEEIDSGDSTVKRPTYISSSLTDECKMDMRCSKWLWEKYTKVCAEHTN
jgi:hypothetical protein